MKQMDSTQIYHILENLSNLEQSFLEYSSSSKNFVEFGTYLAYMDNMVIRRHDLWKFYFRSPISSSPMSSASQALPNVLFDNLTIQESTPFSVCKLFNFPNGPLHQCDYYTILYNYRGLAHITIGKEEHGMEPGDIFIIPPMVPYAISVESESICLAFDVKKAFLNSEYVLLFQDSPKLLSFFSDYLSSTESTGFISIHSDNNQRLQPLALLIFSEYINQEEYFPSAMKNLLALFFTMSLRGQSTTIQTNIAATRNQQNYQEIINYIRTHYQTTSLEDTAEHIHFSKQYVCRIVKEATGDTFSNLLLAERLKVSCNLLATTNASLEEISSMCGFSSASYFSRIFKQIYRMPPSAYRRESSR